MRQFFSVTMPNLLMDFNYQNTKNYRIYTQQEAIWILLGKIHNRFDLYNETINWEIMGIQQGHSKCIYRVWKIIHQYKERKFILAILWRLRTPEYLIEKVNLT
jgi:hypothetical protein